MKDEEVYRLVVPSYLVTGGDGFDVIKNETLNHNSGETSKPTEDLCGQISIMLFVLTFLLRPHRRPGHLCRVQLHHTETEGLPICRGTHQDLQLSCWSGGAGLVSGFTGAALDSVCDPVGPSPGDTKSTQGPDTFTNHM